MRNRFRFNYRSVAAWRSRVKVGLVLWALALSGAAAQVGPMLEHVPPRPRALVLDEAGVLSSGERSALERKLVAYDDSTSTQVAVVILNDLGGADPMRLATDIGRAWGVGQQGTDNGVVVLVGIGSRDIAIATGYGAEGGLTDATSGTIIRRVIAPAFRLGDFYAGLDAGTSAVMAALAGEFRAEQVEGGSGDPLVSLALLFVIVLIVVLLVIASRDSGGSSGGGMRGRRGGSGVIFVPGRFGGASGGFSGGGFSGGGFSGGGFGGFGGGGFGGGGASGGW